MEKLMVWLTYDAAGYLHSRGLGAVSVWFAKPSYMTHIIREHNETPFGDEETQRNGFYSTGWRASRSNEARVMFNQLFDYNSDIAITVWAKLQEHFGSANLDEWSVKEAEGVQPEDFLLKVSLEVKFKIPP